MRGVPTPQPVRDHVLKLLRQGIAPPVVMKRMRLPKSTVYRLRQGFIRECALA
jgi:hypothetical protein